jgi:hypothetical protein
MEVDYKQYFENNQKQLRLEEEDAQLYRDVAHAEQAKAEAQLRYNEVVAELDVQIASYWARIQKLGETKAMLKVDNQVSCSVPVITYAPSLIGATAS